MGNSVNNVSTGKPKITGAIHRAPLGTELPTDAKTALNEAFICMGYQADGGVTNTNSPDTDTVKAWGGDTVAIINNGSTDQFKFKMLEAKSTDTLKAVYNSDNVTGDLETGITVRVNSKDKEHASWVIDVIMTDDTMKRIVIPDAVISDLGDITYTDADLVGYDLTLTALPYAAFEGDTHREYISKAATA